MPNYDVTINTTTVGDPTVVLKFKLTNKSNAPGPNTIDSLNVNLKLSSQGRELTPISVNLESAPVGEEIILMSPFSTEIHFDDQVTVQAELRLTASGSSFDLAASGGINSQYAKQGNAFVDSSVTIIRDEALPSYTPGNGDIVAIQCVDPLGNNAFLTGLSNNRVACISPLDPITQPGSLWKIQLTGSADYPVVFKCLLTGGTQPYLHDFYQGINLDTYNGSNYTVIKPGGMYAETISRGNYYITANTAQSSNNVSLVGGATNSKNQRWFFHKIN